MKKLLCIGILTMLASAAPMAAHAAVGDVAGEIYSTDILAVVNGEPMTSYNIGGRTAVIAEELDTGGYGFNHMYNDSERTLYVQTGSNTNVGDVTVERGSVGEVVGNIYETDIKVIFNGHEVPGYNIGGKTAVVIEDLGTPDGTSPNEEYGYTKYLCNFTWDNDTRTVTLDAFMSNYDYDGLSHFIDFSCTDNVITAAYRPDSSYGRSMDVSLSDERYQDMMYLIEPLYFELDGSRTEVGLVCVYPDISDGSLLSVRQMEYDRINALAAPLKPAVLVPYDETMARFENTEEYDIVSRCETDNYTFMFVKFKNEPADSNMHLVSVRKAGGYVTLWTISSEYQTFEVEASGGDMAIASYGPQAIRPGAVGMLNTEFDLNLYVY